MPAKNDTKVEESTATVEEPVKTVREEFAGKIVSMMDVIAPVLIDLIFGDYFDLRDEAQTVAERDALQKFVDLIDRAKQGKNGYDKQLDRIRNLRGTDYVKDVQPFRAPKVATKAKVDGAKILGDLL